MAAHEFVNPYPGAAPFQDRYEDRVIFFGRDRDIARLSGLILSEPHVVLYSRSGLGKSSLINAGVLPKLRSSGCFPVVVRVTYNLDASPVSSIFERIDEEAQKHEVVVEGQSDRSTLWTYFEGVKFFSKGRRPLRVVIILDQFEEMFTRLQPEKRNLFIENLADLARGRVPRSVRKRAIEELDRLTDDDEIQQPREGQSADVIGTVEVARPAVDAKRERLLALAYGGIDLDVKLVISMREEFLPELNVLKEHIPLLLHTMMRLEPLNRAQAEEAIVKPSQQSEILGDSTVNIDPAAVKAMLDFLSEQPSGGNLAENEDIQPVQLQILCRSMYERARGRGSHSISLQDLGGSRGMSRILHGHYNYVVRKFPLLRLGWNSRRFRIATDNLYIFNLPRHAIRNLCEDGLILANGFRNSLEGGYIGATFGVPERDLAELVDQRLLRSDARQHNRFYELSHDRLIGILKKNRRRRRLMEGTVFAVLILAGFVGWYKIPQLLMDFQVRPLRTEILRSTDKARRQAALTKYAEISPTIDFSREDVTNLNFVERDSQVSPDTFNFARSTLSNCIFELGPSGTMELPDIVKIIKRGHYRYVFTGAKISNNTSFDDSKIVFADFSGASITQTTFRGTKVAFTGFFSAELKDVDFSDSSFSEDITGLSTVSFARAGLNNVNFTGADISGVDFSGVRLGDDVNFAETDWWLAENWTDEQLRKLEIKFPHASFVNSDRYTTKLDARKKRVKTHEDRRNRDKFASDVAAGLAKQLNALAWYRAIHGLQLDDAKIESEQSIGLKRDPDYLDTLAYILMQQGDFASAKSLLAEALGLLDTGNPDPPADLKYRSAPIAYKYALTLEYSGEQETAKAYYNMTMSYRPTHERLLVPKPATPARP
jgi:uncharacterized protein YjbI with pentapeptide repeats